MTKTKPNLILSSLALSVLLLGASCAVDGEEDTTFLDETTDDGSDEPDDAPGEEAALSDENPADDQEADILDIAAADETSGDDAGGEARRARGCRVKVMYPKIGSSGNTAASNATGSCYRAPGSTVHFMMRTKTIWGWKTNWNFNKNIPYTGSFNLGGRQVSLLGVSEIYVEATVCWKLKIRHCRSDSATLVLFD